MKSMKKALSLFLALSMLMTVCAVNILAEDTVTLTVPNGNFANTCDANGTMPDGWTPKLVAATAFASNRQYTISSAFANSDAEGAPSSDGSYSLELLDTSTGGLLAESPKISLGSALTEKKEFSLTFDHKSGNGAQYIGAAVNFYNADGKIYNGGEWIDELTSETMTEMTSWQLKDADGKDSFIYIHPSSAWTNTSVSAVAPIGTASVSASFVAATGGALRVYYDNVAISYKSIASAAGLQPVTNLTASAGDGQVTLSWGLPTDATNYAGVKIAVKNGTTPVKEVFVEDAQKTSEIVTQLENGVDYTFEVYAMNAGKTEFSEAVSVNATPAAPVAGVVEIPNGDFEKTVDVNGALVDGWSYQLYVNPEDTLQTGMLYYAMNTEAGNGTSASGKNSLVMKCPGKGTYEAGTGIIVMSPVVPLSEELTANTKFTYTFDYKCIAQNFNTAILFYNAEGKVYNGSEWIDFIVEKDADWKLTDTSGQETYMSIGVTSDNKNKWLSSQIMADAPAGTSGVRVLAVATGGGANKFGIDNLNVTYEVQKPEVTAPNPVTNLKAVAGDKQVALSWNLPEDTANYAGVKIAVKNGVSSVKEVFVEDVAKTSAVITELTNGTNYTFEVYSMNAEKTDFSEAVSVSATPVASSSSESGVVIIPNGDFEKTAAVNSALPDGWSYQVYVQPDAVLDPAQLYYLIGSDRGNGTSAAGSNSLVMKCPGLNAALGYNKPAMMAMSPVVPLESELTEPQKFTYTFDYNAIRYNANTAILFFNAEGKVYNGTEWIDWTVKTDDDWKFTDSSGQKGWFSTDNGTTATGWKTGEIITEAPAGTAGVRVVAVATGGGASLCALDNLNITYGGQTPEITVPNPVTNLKAVSGDKQVTLSWDLPEDTANYAGVKITVKSGSSTVTTLYAEGKEATSKIVNGLTNGTPYTFEVQSMSADKSEFADAVSVTVTPHEEGQIVTIPVKNAIKDRAMYADDHQLTVDLGIISSNPPTGSDGILYNNIVNATNVFDTDNTKLTFSSDTPGVSFVKTPYRLGLTYSGGYSTWADVQKLQLVYRPDASQAGKQVTIQVKATVAESDQVLAQGTASFKVTVTPVPQDEWKPTGEGRETYLTVPNGNFDRTTTANEFKNNFNKDIPGGWHALLWAAPNPVMGDDRVGYNVINKNATTDAGVDGQGMDIKGGVAETTEGNILIESGRIATPSTAARKYTMGFQYKGGRNSGKPAAAMFFYNADGELYMGNGVWKADATAADMWSSKDAEGNAAYLQYDVVSGFTSAKLERFAPEGTSYVTVAFAATGGTAYRFQVDNVSLMYVDNLAPVINTENPYTKTISLGETVRLNLAETFTDPDGDVMTYTIEGTNGIIENGVFSYTPNKLGSATAAVAATDSYGEKTVLNLTLTVNDAVSSTTVNKDIKPVTKATVNGSVVLKKADGSNVTSLSQLNAGETLKINVSLKNTSELPVTTTLLIVKYDANGVVESVTTKVIVIPSTGGDPDYTTVRDYVVENNSGSVEVMLWDSATNLNSLIDPIRI